MSSEPIRYDDRSVASIALIEGEMGNLAADDPVLQFCQRVNKQAYDKAAESRGDTLGALYEAFHEECWKRMVDCYNEKNGTNHPTQL